MMKRGLIFCIMMLLAILCLAEPFPLRLNNSLVWDGSLIPCSDDSRIVYWVDSSPESAQIFAQKISPLGSLLWDDNLLVCESLEPKSLLGVLPSSDGCQIAVWQQKTIDSGYAICHMKIDNQGNRPGTDGISNASKSIARADPGDSTPFAALMKINPCHGQPRTEIFPCWSGETSELISPAIA